jgi:hypothetical protein
LARWSTVPNLLLLDDPAQLTGTAAGDGLASADTAPTVFIAGLASGSTTTDGGAEIDFAGTGAATATADVAVVELDASGARDSTSAATASAPVLTLVADGPATSSANAEPTLAPTAVAAAQGGGSVDVIERIAVRRNGDRPFQMVAA